jgi:hypothetical protein
MTSKNGCRQTRILLYLLQSITVVGRRRRTWSRLLSILLQWRLILLQWRLILLQ